MSIDDLCQPALPWLTERDERLRLEAYLAYQRECMPWSIAVWELSGRSWPCIDDELERVIAVPQPDLVACISEHAPLRCAERAVAAFSELTGLVPERVVLLIGCYGSNAVQAWSEGGPAAVLCAEHLLPARHGLQLCEARAMGWIVHELAHCARYALPGSRSPVAAFPRQALGFRERLDTLPSIERLIDEGIASALQLSATREMGPWPALHFDEADYREILAALPDLLRRGDLRAPAGSQSAMLYLVFRSRDTRKMPAVVLDDRVS